MQKNSLNSRKQFGWCPISEHNIFDPILFSLKILS